MRLSDVKGERTFEVVADIIEPIYRIAQDKTVSDMLRPVPCPEGEDPKGFAARRLVEGVPRLLKTHKAELVAIIAAIEGVDADAYAESLDLAKLAQSLTELVTDPALMGFLASAAPTQGPTGEE